MIKFFLTAIACFVFVSLNAQNPIDCTYTKADSVKVTQLLSSVPTALEGQDAGQLMIHFARKFLGTPYVAKTLEVNREEKLVVNTRQLDCSTYLETVLALTLCAKEGRKTFADYQRVLARIRYKNDTVSYPNRLHYFTWWMTINTEKGIVRELQEPNPPFNATQTIDVHYMSAHVEQYPMLVGRLDYQDEIARMEQNFNGRKYQYIPKAEINNTDLLRQTIHDGDIIGIVTNKDGLDIAHVGIAIWHTDGLHMLHASMLKKKVIEDTQLLKEYLMARKTHLGIRIARP